MARAAALILALAALAPQARAEDLLQVFRDARAYDAQYASARYALQAGLEKLPQGRALLLPILNFTASATRNDFHVEGRYSNPAPGAQRFFTTDIYALSFTQPVYRPQNYAQYGQAQYQVKQAEATFGQAVQDLILRVAQAYFDVLAAQDTLTLVRAQKTAISEQLAQAKRNFEVGTATIVDTHEAQARYDLAVSQEIAAQNDLDTKLRTLQQITGKEYAVLKPLRSQVALSPPNPSTMDSWVELAEKQAYPVLVQEAGGEIAKLEVQRNRAGYLPTLDLIGSYQQTNQTASVLTAQGSLLAQTQIGLQFALPLYAGGGLSSREREAAANYEKAKQDLENARRSAVLLARQSYLAVINGIAQVKALEQGVVSSQSALDSNKLGYEVGVRINIDVLNSQQQLYSTLRDLSVARYNTITSHLRLKAAAGGLHEDDVEEVNRALQP